MSIKFKLLVLLLFQFILSLANVPIKGHFSDFNNEPIVVRVYENGVEKFLTKLFTDADGYMNYTIPFDYSGKIILDFSKGRLELLTDNSPIEFEATIKSFPHKVTYKTGINQTLNRYYEVKQYEIIRDQSLNELRQFYSPQDPFYKALIQETERINALPKVNIENTGLEYYVKTEQALEELKNNNKTAEENLINIQNHLLNDGEELENFGFLPKFISNYISFAVSGATSVDDAKIRIESSMNSLLNQMGEDTGRGQSTMSILIDLLKSNGFTDLASKYVDKAASLTCEITPDLKAQIESNKSIQIGKQVPNIIFDKPINGKKSLYDINADKKILIFWGSWCPHCKKEIPFIKEFYKSFKADGGEIVTFAIDLSEKDYKNAMQGTEWYNYSDLLKWDSPTVKTYGVTGTPTMYLLDKDNKIIKEGGQISDFESY